MQTLPGSNDGTQGPHLPQEQKVEVRPVRPREDAGSEAEAVDPQFLTLSTTPKLATMTA
jgi:hypothetical protein